MRNRDRTLLTMEERLELAAKSQAVSPEAAAKMVQRFSKIHTARFLCDEPTIKAMYGLTGEFWDVLGENLFCYEGFCHIFRLAIGRDDNILREFEMSAGEEGGLYQPVWGVRINNALVLLGLLLLDHAKGGTKYRDIYHCTRMNLKQYLDAMVDLSFREDGTLDEERAKRFRSWRELFLKDNDGSRPLKEALTDILRRYIAAWQELDHLDPCGYFFTRSCEYPEDVPDLSDKNVACRTLSSQIFLSERDYRAQALRKLAPESPSRDLGESPEKSISRERLSRAMREINTSVTDLFMLLVEPYLMME